MFIQKHSYLYRLWVFAFFGMVVLGADVAQASNLDQVTIKAAAKEKVLVSPTPTKLDAGLARFCPTSFPNGQVKVLPYQHTPYAEFGRQVAMDSGRMAIVSGSELSSHQVPYSIAICELDSSNRWKYITKISASDEISSVALSGDYLAFGMSLNYQRQKVVVYHWDLNQKTWNYLADITPSSFSVPPDYRVSGFGYSLAMDGNRIVIGAPSTYVLIYGGLLDDGGEYGVAFVAKINSSGGLEEQGMLKLNRNEYSEGIEFGKSVDISGNIIVIGAPDTGGWWRSFFLEEDKYADVGSGSAFVFEWNGSVWQRVRTTLRGVPASGHDAFGMDVAVDQDIIAIGSPGYSANTQNLASGAVYVFTKMNGLWGQQGSAVLNYDPSNYRFFGEKIDLSHSIAITSAEKRVESFQIPNLAERNEPSAPLGRATSLHSEPIGGVVYFFPVHSSVSGLPPPILGFGRNRLFPFDTTVSDAFGDSLALDQSTGFIAIGDPLNVERCDPAVHYGYCLAGAIYLFSFPPPSDIEVHLSSDSQPVAGELHTYTIGVKNYWSQSMRDVILTLRVSPFAFLEGVNFPPSLASVQTSILGGDPSFDLQLQWNLGTIAAGSTVELPVQVIHPDGGDLARATVIITTSSPDSVLQNNTATLDLNVQANPDYLTFGNLERLRQGQWAGVPKSGPGFIVCEGDQLRVHVTRVLGNPSGAGISATARLEVSPSYRSTYLAQSGSDYQLSSNDLTYPSASTDQYAELRIIDDGVAERDEDLLLHLTQLRHVGLYPLMPEQLYLTIKDAWICNLNLPGPLPAVPRN